MQKYGIFFSFSTGWAVWSWQENEELDNLQPLLLNNSNDGADWKAHGVTAKQVWGRQRNTQLGSEALFEVTEGIIRQQIRKGNLPEE